MYKQRGGQINALESPEFFAGVQLDPSNSWIKLAQLMPWDEIEGEYTARLEGARRGIRPNSHAWQWGR